MTTTPYPDPNLPEVDPERIVRAGDAHTRQHRRELGLMFVGIIAMWALLLWRGYVADNRAVDAAEAEAERRDAQECALKRTEDFQGAVADVLLVLVDPDTDEPASDARLRTALDRLEVYAREASTSSLECLTDPD